MFRSTDMHGVYAIIPTPATPDAARYDATATVDLQETQRLVHALLSDGVSGIIALGTTGECATLSADDYEAFVRCLAASVDRRVPLFVGASALGGQEVLRRMRLLASVGCTGTLLGPPMWQPVTDAMAVDFYRQLGALMPTLAIMVYANQRVFRYAFGTSFWRGVVECCPSVVAAKYLRPHNLEELLKVVDGQVNLMPSELTLADFYRTSPATTTACWSTSASMGPGPVVRLLADCLSGDESRMLNQEKAVAWANEPLLEVIRDGEVFASHNIQIEKVRMEVAGYCRPGPVRPPYNDLPERIRAAAQECGTRWASIR